MTLQGHNGKKESFPTVFSLNQCLGYLYAPFISDGKYQPDSLLLRQKIGAMFLSLFHSSLVSISSSD